MTTSKRPKASAKKKGTAASPKAAKAAAPARPTVRPAGRAKPKPGSVKEKEPKETVTKAKKIEVEKEQDKPTKAAEAKGSSKRTKAAAAAAPAATRAQYDLDGPIPPEGAGLPPKVGALLGVGQRALGIKAFRPGQAEAFAHLLAGEDVLAVMPTGSGKSLLYQLPSLILPGVTVVVSPLIALIKDQIDKMVAKGVTAVRIDSTLTVKQRREVDALIRAPGGKLLLTTPERMADPEFRVFLREAASGVGVSRFVVDEAHCVSQWGHDFRPAYLSLRKALEDVGRPPVLAVTATAPPHVREDILFQLGMERAQTVTTTFDRPNLHHEVIIFSDEDEKMKTLVTLLKKLPRPGIVYCATVKKVEELYEALTRWGVPVGKYHGRMNKGERDRSQEEFMASSELVMVATNAFGLGVDKPNIRNVLHYHVPGSLETYAQEAGRGGRDGKPSRCVLLFSPDDVAIQEYFLSGTYPTKRQVRQVYEALVAFTERHRSNHRLAADTPPTVANLALSSGVGAQRTRTVLSLLKDERFIVEEEGGLFYVADPPPEYAELMERAKQYEARRIADRMRLDSLLAYVKAAGCRNQVILSYLGEAEPPRCGRCDNCLRSREAALAAATEASRLGASVTRILDEDGVEVAKPRREIKAKVVRIDQPPAPPPGTMAAEGAAAPSAAAAEPARAPTVLKRVKPGAAPAPAPAPSKVPPNGAAPAAEVDATLGIEPLAARTARIAPEPAQAPPDEDDDELDDDELDDDELEDDEDDDLELVDEDDDDFDDEDDDDLDDDEDDDDLDDDEDDDLDDDDYEVIDKTAAELAEEGVEGPGEITVLARKRVPKAPKQRPQQVADASSASAAEARRRRRRRRRKRRAMLPPKSAFTTPVLSTGMPLADAAPRRGGGGGPVIEYVRGPMRIAAAPVASANPNDAGVARRSKKRSRWERRAGFDRGADRGADRGVGRGAGAGGAPRFERGPRPLGPGDGPRLDAPPGAHAAGENGAPKRRRRRRRRRGLNGAPMQGMLPPNGSALGDATEPVSFFLQSGAPAPGPVLLGPDGQPLRKRRRRRRRGRGGRQREWRPNGEGPGGDGPGGDGPGGGGPSGDGGNGAV